MQKQQIKCVVAPDKVGGHTKRIVVGSVSIADINRIINEKKYI